MPAVASTESMGETAENVAAQARVGRADQDQFALQSHHRAVQAQRDGNFAAEMVPVTTSSGVIAIDEGPRPDATLERLAALPTVFRDDGTVTAGNSSPLSDGAAALLLVGERVASAREEPPLARVLASAVVGVDPALMGMGPVPASRQALERAELELGQIDQFEINEAFASQALACILELGIDPTLVNPDGGGIALGHPLGSSGARIVGRLATSLRQRGKRFGLAAMCIGVGQGIAVVLENPEAR
jgi:acetyl-CoA acetyltransferase family protein